MAKKFSINFDLGTAIADLKKVNDLAKQTNTNFFDSEQALKKQKNALDLSLVSMNREQIAQSNIGFQIDRVNKKLEETTKLRGAFETLISHPMDTLAEGVSQIPILGGALEKMFRRPIDNLNRMNKGFTEFNEAFMVIQKEAGGMDNVLTGFFKNFGDNAKQFGNNFKSIMGSTSKALMKNFTVAFSAIIPQIGAIVVAFAPIAAVVAGVVAAVFVLKKVWELNIGGIQKSVFGLVGAIRDTLGKSMIQFQKILQKTGPLFKVVFTPVFAILKGLVTVIGSVIGAVLTIIDPIASAIGEVFKPFAKLMGKGKGIGSVFKTVGTVIGGVAKVIAFSLKVSLFPLILLAKGLGKLINLGTKLRESFMKLPFVQKIFDGIGKAVTFLKGLLDSLLAPFKFIIEGAEKIGKFLGFLGGEKPAVPGGVAPVERGAGTAVTNTTQRQTTVSPTITVNTSREISGAGARDFASTLSGLITTQAKTT